MRENRKWSICTAAILNFPAKQDIFLKIKELCHLEHKTPEQMPFKFLRYPIWIKRYEEKSEMSGRKLVSESVRNIKRSYLKRLKNRVT